jgi:hypothetical protein
MKNKLLLLAMGFALTTQMIMAQVPSYVPTNGLVGYWPFNGNANDESGNGNNGAVNGAILTTDRFGILNSAYDYNGTNNNINFGSSTIFGLTSNNILTFSVWVRPLRASNNANIMDGVFSKYQDLNISNSNYYFSIDKNVSSPSNPPIGVITANGTNSIGATCELNTWQHYVIVMQSGLNNIKVYRNGVLDNTGTVNFSNLISSSNLYLGFIPTTSTNITQSNFLGKIDDFSIWNRALTQQEITNLYNSANTNECLTMTINTGVLSTNPVTYTSTVNIYPNPANDQITIDCGNLANVVGWNIKITNMLGQEVFNQPMNTQQYVVPLNSWTGQDMYFVKIINAQNEVVNIKKIILQ